MVGQAKLLNKLKSYTLKTLPQTIIFIGNKGCGKHTLVSEMRNYFNLDLIDMSSNISLDYINDIYTKALPAFYLINMDVLTEKQQNMILKFIEEPIKGSYIILLSSNKANLLNTIVNRCIIYTFDPYTREELSNFIDKDLNESDTNKILELCSTPGQILSTSLKNLEDLYKLCDNIIYKMSIANYSNALSIANKINFKDEYDKFDIDIFFTALLNKIKIEYFKSNDNRIFELYNITLNYKKRLRDLRINKEMLIENFISYVWKFNKERI